MGSLKSNDALTNLVRLVYALLIILAVIIVLPKAVTCLFPFLLAWIISLIIRPIAEVLEKFHIHKRIGVLISMLIVLAGLCFVVYFVSKAVIGEVQTITGMFSDTRDGLPVFIWDIIDAFPEKVRNLILPLTEGYNFDVEDLIFPALRSALPKLGGAAGKLPSALIFTVVFIMSIYFMSYDEKGLREEIKKFVSPAIIDKLRRIRKIFSTAFSGYIKAQLIIMAVVFVVLLTGFAVMKVEFSILLAFVISLVDAIPVLGTGLVLNPMAFIYLIQGDYFRAIGFVSLYVVVLVLRHFIEPRVLSGQLGMHPIITLVSMYMGFKLIGVSGMIIGPLLALIVISFLNAERLEAEKNAG